MACQVFQWLIAGAGPTTFQHALVGIGCLLAYDAGNRWWKRRNGVRSANDDENLSGDQTSYRRAA